MTDLTISLDDADRAIVRALQADGRAPLRRIAAEIGLSEGAVRKRLRRLKERGGLQIVAVTQPLRFGFLHARVQLRAGAELERVADWLAGYAEVEYVVVRLGRADLEFDVYARDVNELDRLLAAVRERGAEVVDSTIITRVRKESFDGVV